MSVCQMSPCESVKSTQKLEVSGMEEDDGSVVILVMPCLVLAMSSMNFALRSSVVRQR